MNFSRLKAAIVLFCLILIAALWALTLQRIEFEHDQAISAETEQNSNLVIAFEEQVVRTLNSADQTLRVLRRDYTERGLMANFTRYIADTGIDSRVFNVISLVDEHGDLLVSSLPTGQVNYADREHFQFHLLNGKDELYISKPVLGRISGKWQIPMTRRISKPDGSFGGVVVLSVDPGYFTDFYQKADLGKQASVLLAGTDGIVRARRIGSTSSFGEDISRSALMARQATAPAGNYIGSGELDGTRRIFSYRTLATYPLIALVGTAEAEVLAPFRQRQYNYYLVATLASVFILLFAGGLIAALWRQRQAIEALAESDARFRATFDQASVGISRTGLDGRYLQVNPALCDMLGYTEQELLARRFIDVTHPDDVASGNADIRARLISGSSPDTPPEAEKRYLRRDGTTIWVLITVSVVRDVTGNPLYFSTMVQNITQRKELQERMMHLAHYDNLTQLPNRLLCYDRLKQAVVQAQRSGSLVGVLFIDLDRFKNINDTLGHGYGDRLLTEVAARLSACIRAGDTVGRLGGDEFMVILSGLANAQDCALVAEKALAAMSRAFHLDEHEAYVTASIGISVHPGDGDGVEALIKNADAAMFRAKDIGKNTYQFYTVQMNELAMEKMQMDSALRGALERNEFLLHFQPKASLASGGITGFEALLRWQRPGSGLILPVHFIPLLEDSGQIVPVGAWVIVAACRQLRAWQQAGIAPLPIAVNLSAKQFRHQDIFSVIEQALREHSVDPALLEVEITESAVMHSPEDAIVMLGRLHAHRVHITIDDFGTGYSSLAYLKRFPIDTIKLDHSFVDGLPDDAHDASIARAVITMAHSLNLTVIGEGVETEAQRVFLAEYGCDEMQGYYFSRPLPALQCTELLRQRKKLPLIAGPDAMTAAEFVQ